MCLQDLVLKVIIELLSMSYRNDKDLIIFHNRGVLHTVIGTLQPDQVRVYHQCNLAACEDPIGPSNEDIIKWA